MSTNKNLSYFLCSQEVIDKFPEFEHSKPFKSGFDYDKDDNYYVSLLNFNIVEKYYKENIEVLDQTDDYNDFWLQECVAGSMDISKITLSGIKKMGLLYEISLKLNLSQMQNIAMCIFNLSEKYKLSPIEFINKYTK